MNDFQNHYVEGKESDKRECKLNGFICKNSHNYKILWRQRTTEGCLGMGVGRHELVWKGQEGGITK